MSSLLAGLLASLQSCPMLCDPMDHSLPGSCVHGISRQEYWGGLPFPSPGDLPDPGIEPTSLVSPALAGGSLPLVPPGRPRCQDHQDICISGFAILRLLLTAHLHA